MARKQKKRATPQLSPAFKKLADRLLGGLKDEERDHYALGTLWNQLAHERYAEKELGQSATDWFNARYKTYCKARTALRLGGVVTHFDEPTLEAEGDVRLELAIAYCHHSRYKIPKDPRPLPILFKDPQGNSFNKPFSECTVQELEWAVRPPGRHPKHKKPEPPPPPPPPADPDPLRDPGMWEDSLQGYVHMNLIKIGAATPGPSVSGSSWEWKGNEPCFSLRKIHRKLLRQAAKVLVDSMDQCVRDHKDDPLMPPVPDWLLP